MLLLPTSSTFTNNFFACNFQLLRARALHERGQQINAEGNADLALAVWSLALTLVEPDQAETDAPAAIVPAVAENSELAADIRLERAAALKRQGHTTAARNELQHALVSCSKPWRKFDCVHHHTL